MSHQTQVKDLLNFERRMLFGEALRNMCAVFIDVAQQDDPRIDEYLEAHQRAMDALARMTGERED